MKAHDIPPAGSPRRTSAVLAIILKVAGSLVVIVGTVFGVTFFASMAAERAGLVLAPALGIATMIVMTWGFGVLLWALAHLITHRNGASGQPTLHAGAGDALPQADVELVADDVSQRDAELSGKILDTLNEINANILLTPAQREEKRLRLVGKQADEIASGIEADIEAGDFAAAESGLDRLRSVWPECPEQDRLNASLQQARDAAFKTELRTKTKLVEDLMAVADFTRAQDVAEELLHSQSSSVEAIALLDRVKREGSTFFEERRSRMYSLIEQHVEAKRWTDALPAAREFLRVFPGTSEAQLIGAQMSTLEENARIAEVRLLRDEIRSLFGRRRYADALKLAEDVVERFPETAAAEELQKQMPRLKQLAGKDGGKA